MDPLIYSIWFGLLGDRYSNGSPYATGPLSCLSVCNVGVLWPNGWMDQDAAWYGGEPQPRQHCIRWGPSFPPQKGAQQPPPLFSPCLLWPNGWMDQDETRHEGRPRRRPHCVRWRRSSPPRKGHSPQFSAHVRCGQMAGWIKMPLSMEIGLGPSHIVLDGDPATPQKRGHSSQFSADVCCGQTVAHLSCCWALVSDWCRCLVFCSVLWHSLVTGRVSSYPQRFSCDDLVQPGVNPKERRLNKNWK